MSAYGEQPPRARAAPLAPTRWAGALTVHHLTAATAPAALAALLHALFAAELARGTTYPQERMTRAGFDAYFLAADVFVGILEPGGGAAVPLTVEAARGGRPWAECVGGMYYVKQNYPGRSGHICNAGFLVPPPLRGRGLATALARSFVHYAPRLGYEASVFNLVYVNNVASVRIWDRLGFEKIGRIPRAGRLRCGEGGEEEYVDAWVVYKRFDLDAAGAGVGGDVESS